MNIDKTIDKFLLKYENIFLILILFFAFILRVLYLDVDSMWIDETISATAATAILEHGYPLLDSGGQYWRAYIFHYIMAFFIFIFEGDFGARFISVVFGVLTVWLAYIFGSEFIQKGSGGLIFAFLTSIFVLEIIYSKQARFYQAFQFFYFLSFYLFYKIIIFNKRIFKKRFWNYFILVLSIFMTTHLQFMGYIAIPLLVGVYFVHKFNFKNKFGLLKNKFFLLGIGLGVLFSVYIIYTMKKNFTLFFLKRYLVYSYSYTDYIFKYYILIILFVIGVILYFYRDSRFNLSLLLYFIVPCIGVFFMSSFGTRYIYFAVFPILFYISYMFSKIQFKYFVMILMVIFLHGQSFDVNGIKNPLYDISMPLADYKSAFGVVGDDIPLVTTWAAGGVWYDKSPDYWIYYSVGGRENESWDYNGKELFSGAEIIYNATDLPDNFYFVIDAQGYRKIDKSYHSVINSSCSTIDNFYRIGVLNCSLR